MHLRRLPQGGRRLITASALCALAVGLLWSLQTATHVEAYDVVTKVDVWGERGAFTYAPLTADGSERPMGEPGYFTSDAPRVRVAFSWTLDAPGAERVAAVGDLRLVVRHEGGGGRAAWSDTTDLASGTLEGSADDELLLRGEMDIPETRARIERTPGRDAARATWTLVATVRFASAPNAQHAAEASQFAIPLDYSPPLYSLPAADAATFAKDHSRSEVAHHAERGGLPALVARPAGPALLLVGLVGFVATLPVTPPTEDA